MDSYPLSKLKAPGLSARKWTKLLIMMLCGLVEESYKSQRCVLEFELQLCCMGSR